MVTPTEVSKDILSRSFYTTVGGLYLGEFETLVERDTNIYALVLLALALKQGLPFSAISAKKLNNVLLGDFDVEYYNAGGEEHVVVDLSPVLHEGTWFTFIGDVKNGTAEFINLARQMMFTGIRAQMGGRVMPAQPFAGAGVETFAQLAEYVNRSLYEMYNGVPLAGKPAGYDDHKRRQKRQAMAFDCFLAAFILTMPLVTRYATMLLPPLIILLFYRLWSRTQE